MRLVYRRKCTCTSTTFTSQKYKLNIKYKVRISHLKYIFQRDYQQKWTEEVFIITHRVHQQGINLYQIKDYANEAIDGYFYEHELQKVIKEDDDLFRVEKVIKSRKRRGQLEHFVKWMGWPAKFNSWIKDSDIKRL